MSSLPLLSAATSQALEFPALLEVLAELAASDLGADRIRALTPFPDEARLTARRARFEEARRLVGERPLVPPFEGSLRDLLGRLVTGRPPVSGPDLVQLAVFLRACREAAARVRDADPPCPALRELTAEQPDLSELERSIGSTLDRRGGVRDDASPQLIELRRAIRTSRDRLYRELTDYVGAHRDGLAEETIPLRGGRLMLMLPAGSRGRLAGLTHGRSGSGKTFYFEPLEVVETNNSLQQATEDEEAERQRLLAELIGRARAVLDELRLLAEGMAELDLLQASCRFAELTDGRLAEISPRHELRLVAARHPLLDPRLADLRERALGQAGHRDAIIPLDLELDPETRALVVTGPNAGGKTVALKTTGLLALASQCGLPVPVGAGSRLPVVARLVAIVGDEQDLLSDRSTFSGRLLRLKEAWEGAGPASLLLLDELGSGTDPEEGSALSVALLEGLLESQSLAVITTHLTQLAAAALELSGATCAAMEFDSASGEPTFRLLPGPPGGSEALRLARRLGLPAAWLDRAEERLGSEHRRLRRLLAEVEQIRQDLARTRERAEQEARDAEKLRRRVEEEERALAEERRSVGRRLTAELETFRGRTRARLREEIERLRGELEAGRRKGLAEKATERLFAQAPEMAVPEQDDDGPLIEGETVRHRSLGWEGTLEKLQGVRAEVFVRGKRVRCRADELGPVGRGASRAGTAPRGKLSVTLGSEAAREVPRELKLLGQRVEPALESLDVYLDQALLAALPEVRIVHGHGTGRLRDAIRRFLREHRAVAGQRPGKPDEGGDGATVVQLRRE